MLALILWLVPRTPTSALIVLVVVFFAFEVVICTFGRWIRTFGTIVLIVLMVWLGISVWPEAPDIGAMFIYRQIPGPAILLINTSNLPVKDPKYEINMWDLDTDQQLFMPAQIGDWIRAHRSQGPNPVFGFPVSNALKVGHRLFGFAWVGCPACVHERYYWLFVTYGSGGWYREFQNDLGFMPLTSFVAARLQQIKSNQETVLSNFPLKAQRTIDDDIPGKF